MSISFAPGPSPSPSPSPTPWAPASVIIGARELVAGLHEVLWAARSPREMLDAVAELERFKSELAAIEAAVVAEVDATKAAAQDQWGSAADFLTAVSGGFRGSGGTSVRLARALTGDREGTLEALRTAVISRAQAQVIVATVEALPINHDLRRRAELAMLKHAETFNASELKEIGKKLVEVLDPEGSERKSEKDLARQEGGPPSRTPR